MLVVHWRPDAILESHVSFGVFEIKSLARTAVIHAPVAFRVIADSMETFRASTAYNASFKEEKFHLLRMMTQKHDHSPQIHLRNHHGYFSFMHAAQSLSSNSSKFIAAEKR